MASSGLPIDSGWAWIILASHFIILTVEGAVTYSVGTFNVIFLEHFSGSRATIATVGSLVMGLQFLTGPLCSLVISRLGWRSACMLGSVVAGVGALLSSFSTKIWHLYLTFGVMTGCGTGWTYVSGTVALGHYFKRYMVLAYGIASLGVGLGSLALPPIIDFLLTWLSWREVLTVMGCICLQKCVCGALLRPLDESTVTTSKKNGSYDYDMETAACAESAHLDEKDTQSNSDLDETAICSSAFVLLCGSILAAGIGVSAVYLHLSAFSVTQGATVEEASLYLTVIGFGSMVGRGLAGLAGNDSTVDVLTLYIGSLGLLGLCTVFFPLVASFYSTRMLYACMFGLYTGTNGVLFAPITVELLGVRNLNVAFGVEMFVCGAAYLSGPPIAGLLFDVTGFYTLSFAASGLCLLAGALTSMLIPVATFTRTRHSEDAAQVNFVEDKAKIKLMNRESVPC